MMLANAMCAAGALLCGLGVGSMSVVSAAFGPPRCVDTCQFQMGWTVACPQIGVNTTVQPGSTAGTCVCVGATCTETATCNVTFTVTFFTQPPYGGVVHGDGQTGGTCSDCGTNPTSIDVGYWNSQADYLAGNPGVCATTLIYMCDACWGTCP